MTRQLKDAKSYNSIHNWIQYSPWNASSLDQCVKRSRFCRVLLRFCFLAKKECHFHIAPFEKREWHSFIALSSKDGSGTQEWCSKECSLSWLNSQMMGCSIILPKPNLNQPTNLGRLSYILILMIFKCML